MQLGEPLLSDLQKIYPPADILNGSEYGYMGEDESHAEIGRPLYVLRPRSHQQVVETVHWAKANKISLVPSGGRTGLSGGACAGNKEVVISLSMLNKISDFDAMGGLVTVEAGVALADLQRYVAERGWFYPVDYASRDSAQMGGAVATNAGGLRVLRFGMTGDWLAGLTAVTGNGDTLHINRNLIKDNAGYDLKRLLVGSEGTLAIITSVTFRLASPMPPQRTLLVGVHSLTQLLQVFTKARNIVPLSAAEFFCNNAMHHVLQGHGFGNPLGRNYPYYLLIEHDQQIKQCDVLDDMLSDYAVIVSQNDQQAKMLWRLRELISSTINPLKPYKIDIACRLSVIDQWIMDIEKGFLALNPDVHLVWFGHLGDGNVHLNVIRPGNMTAAAFPVLAAEFAPVIARITRRYVATASGEHGIGLLKKSLLASSRTSEEIELYRQIKSVFDPAGILNPGKMLD